MGQAHAVDNDGQAVRTSWLTRAMTAAELRRLPDWIIRAGIRRLLRGRLRELHRDQLGFSLDQFVKATSSQPIAVVPEKANEQHYEVPAQFYDKVLGPHRKYSCGYWSENCKTLADAERIGLEKTCANADLRDGQDILELGCGWGSLSLWMAQQCPTSRITAVSNSNSQREYIVSEAQERGLKNLRVVTCDINNFQPDARFDRIVSVEMFEHLRNHQQIFNRLADWIHADGKLLIHVFCHHSTPYLFRTDGDANWMGRYFFTGGMMPSPDLLAASTDRFVQREQWKWSGMHYAKSCRAWLENQDRNSQELMPIMAQVYGAEDAQMWFGRWRIFFMACEELFRFRGGNEWHVVHTLFEPN